MRSRGFTLIELLVVIAIIAVLAAVIFPVLSRAMEQGRTASCSSNLHQIFGALAMYCDDSGGFMPPSLPINFYEPRKNMQEPPDPRQIHSLLLKYLSGKLEIFRCPSDSIVPRTVNGVFVMPPREWWDWFNDPDRGSKPEPPTPPGFDRRIVLCTFPLYGSSYQWRLGYEEPVYWGNVSPDGQKGTLLLSGKPIAAVAQPSRIATARDAQPRHYYTRTHSRMDWKDPNQGGNVLFLDGHVKFTLGTEFLGGIF